jgi:hypothetical protein
MGGTPSKPLPSMTEPSKTNVGGKAYGWRIGPDQVNEPVSMNAIPQGLGVRVVSSKKYNK